MTKVVTLDGRDFASIDPPINASRYDKWDEVPDGPGYSRFSDGYDFLEKANEEEFEQFYEYAQRDEDFKFHQQKVLREKGYDESLRFIAAGLAEDFIAEKLESGA